MINKYYHFPVKQQQRSSSSDAAYVFAVGGKRILCGSADRERKKELNEIIYSFSYYKDNEVICSFCLFVSQSAGGGRMAGKPGDGKILQR